MKSLLFSAMLLATAVCGTTESRAATLGLVTESPSLSAGFAFVDYLEFGSDGDLSSFGAEITHAEGFAPSGIATFGFGVGISLADPASDPAGGFDIIDDGGLFLAGELIAVGFIEDVIELQFGNLTGSAAASFTSSVLARISFLDPLGDDPFAAFSDGTSMFASIDISSVQDVTTPEVPLPGGFVFLASGLLGAVSMRWCI